MPVSLINKRVYITNPDFVFLLYPAFQVVTSLATVQGKSVIFRYNTTGNQDYGFLTTQKALQDEEIDHIILLNSRWGSDAEVVGRDQYLELVGSVRKIRMSTRVTSMMERISDEEFWRFLKRSIMLKKWDYSFFEKKHQVYKLFEALFGLDTDVASAYFATRKHLAPEEILSSILSFLIRIQNFEEEKDTLGAYYKVLLSQSKLRLMGVKRAIQAFINLPQEIPDDPKILGLFLSLKEGR